MLKKNFKIIKKSINEGDAFHKRAFQYFSIFINFLHNENILYYLCGGTLLGCIRHGERIAWDDDYDIFMKICDMKLLEKYSVDKSNVKHLKDLFNPKSIIIYYLKINNHYFLIFKTDGGFHRLWYV
ncbi:MAG: LicD family protein, partial [Flavobacteriales bacterium]|nr:LicD family protein [Flavobacteriales bacterium]